MPSNPYDERYQKPGYYWGTKPSVLCDHLLSFIPESQRASKLVVDIGCGEGRNAVYMALNGLNVWAMDASEVALKKVVQMAQENGVLVATSCQDINGCDLPTGFDILLSTGTVQYLRPDSRQAEFERMKRLTKPGGLHAISALLTKPFIPAAPDADATAVLFKSGELLGYYWDWEVLYSIEEIFDCTSGGTPQRHAVNRVIAKKP
jgi:tellurite methyltransferase